MKPLITIGLPVYNAADTVRYAICSVLNQTFTDYELIVTDDGSTDSTMKVIQSIEDPRIRIIHHDENRGIAYRLNEEINVAQGQFFARMDADDIMMPDRLAKQVEALEQHPEIDVLGTAIVVMDDNHVIMGQRGTVLPKSEIVDVDYLLHPTVMGRTSWFMANQYNVSYSGWEDYELWLRTKMFSRFKALSEPLLFYRDSTVFDVQQFLHRRRVGLCVIWHERGFYTSNMQFIKALISNLLSCLAVPVIHLLHLDEWKTRGRNTTIPDLDKKKYYDILNTLVAQ